MTFLRKQMIAALQLTGKGERTQEAYVRTVRMLSKFYAKSPDRIDEQELQEYFLHRKNVTGWSPSTMKVCYCGIRFFYQKVLKRDWHILGIVRASVERKLPSVLSAKEVRAILATVSTPSNYAYLTTVYSCGLRLREAIHLEISDIDSDRMMVHVHRGKGAKDRYVPLPHSTLVVLRKYWATHRHPQFLFPATGRSRREAKKATQPTAKATVQGAFRRAFQKTGIKKRKVSVHTLRHSYATHLLEASVNIHAIQRYLGHSRLETTMLYLHLTNKGQADAFVKIDSVMEGL